jgi:ribosomal protein S18 acetylase RimI-like enzyme
MTATATPASGLHIRRVVPTDHDALFEICLRTADSGEDATALYSEPHLPGYVWVMPYAELEPDFAFVLADGDQTIGYVVAAADTAAFEQRLKTDWWPKVRRAVAGVVPSRPLDFTVLERINTPETHEDWLAADYPAHLHINILPQAQAAGWGRRLIETELDALRQAGVRGVHLGVSPTNERAKGFYRHVGFTDISREDHVLFGMKL